MTDIVPDREPELVIEEVDDPCIGVADLVESEIDRDDEPYEEVIVLDLRAVADDLRLN